MTKNLKTKMMYELNTVKDLMDWIGNETIYTVKVVDDSEYDPERCNDGGGYSYTTKYTAIVGGMFEVEYSTSADIDYCPCCGQFGDHYDHETCEYSCGEFTHVSLEEMLEGVLASLKRECGVSIITDNHEYNVYI